jgi:hypothetical protein
MDMYAEVRSIIGKYEQAMRSKIVPKGFYQRWELDMIKDFDRLLWNYKPENIFQWYELKHYIIGLFNANGFNREHYGSTSQLFSEIIGAHSTTVVVHTEVIDQSFTAEKTFMVRCGHVVKDAQEINEFIIDQVSQQIYEGNWDDSEDAQFDNSADGLHLIRPTADHCRIINELFDSMSREEIFSKANEDKSVGNLVAHLNQSEAYFSMSGDVYNSYSVDIDVYYSNTQYIGMLPMWVK